MSTIYDFSIADAQGNPKSLTQYQGKLILVVNTASKCGFTPQYKELQALYEIWHAKGLEILAFPCNQFGQQEPGSDTEIQQFCQLNYGLTFPVMAKIDVNGENAHPLYKYLCSQIKSVRGQRYPMELHQVPDRPRRERGQAIRIQCKPAGNWRGN